MVMELINVLFVISCFVAFHNANAKDCSKGEEVWCGSLKQAITCNAVKHCKNTVWKFEIPLEDPSETCLFCETIVKDVVDLLSNNKSMEFIQNIMMDVCNLIPSKGISAECKMLVKEDLPYIIELIKENVSPKVICGLLGLCKNQFYSFHQTGSDEHFYFENNEKLNSANKVKGMCEDCIDLVNKTRENLLSVETEKKVIRIIENVVCRFLIIGKKKCDQVTEKYIPQLFEKLRKNFNPEKICFIFCNTNGTSADIKQKIAADTAVFKIKSQKSPNSQCIGCKVSTSYLLQTLVNPKIEEAIIDFMMSNICPLFGDASKECYVMTSAFGATALKMIITHLDEEMLCNKIGSCNSTKGIDDKDIHELVGSDKCTSCQTVVQYLESLLETDVFVSKIELVLSKACDVFPDSVKQSCHDAIKEYGNLIIHYIITFESPREICKFLNFCEEAIIQGGKGLHDRCLEGPKFWCSSPESAELCVAEEHCKKFVWT